MAPGVERASAGGNGGAAGTVTEVSAPDPAGIPAGPGAGPGPDDPAGTPGTASPALNGSASGQLVTGQLVAGQPRGWRRGWRRGNPAVAAVASVPVPGPVRPGPEIHLASNDPLVGYLLSAAGAVDIRGLELDSPALAAMREA